MKAKYNVGDKVQLNWQHNNSVVTLLKFDTVTMWKSKTIKPVIIYSKVNYNKGTTFTGWAYLSQVKKIVSDLQLKQSV